MTADDAGAGASAHNSALGGALRGGANAAPAGISSEPATTRVDFYVIQTDSARERLRTACRVVEKAYLAGHTVLVWHTEVEELREFDDLLWTFSDGSFVPHEAITAAGFAAAPVLLTSSPTPPGGCDVLVNLAPEVPACVAETRRVAEFIDGDPVRRQAGRARFRSYKDRGWSPTTHNL